MTIVQDKIEDFEQKAWTENIESKKRLSAFANVDPAGHFSRQPKSFFDSSVDMAKSTCRKNSGDGSNVFSWWCAREARCVVRWAPAVACHSRFIVANVARIFRSDGTITSSSLSIPSLEDRSRWNGCGWVHLSSDVRFPLHVCSVFVQREGTAFPSEVCLLHLSRCAVLVPCGMSKITNKSLSGRSANPAKVHFVFAMWSSEHAAVALVPHDHHFYL
jgi:hypothetical protein